MGLLVGDILDSGGGRVQKLRRSRGPTTGAGGGDRAPMGSSRSGGMTPCRLWPAMRVISTWRAGVCAGQVIDAVAGGGETLTDAHQVIEVGGEVGEVGDVGAEVVQPAQRNRIGRAPPPAWTLDGSAQRP